MTEESAAPPPAAVNQDPPVPAASSETPVPMAPEPAAPPAVPSKPRGPRVGDMVEYRGYESGGSHDHPAIVTGVNDDGSVDLTVFYRRSPPGVVSGVVEDDDGFFAAKGP